MVSVLNIGEKTVCLDDAAGKEAHGTRGWLSNLTV
jgi:hypothetical protein